MTKSEINPSKIFVIICLFWGFLYAFLSPPFTAADEISHFWKIYMLSEGNFGNSVLTSDVLLGVPTGKILNQSGEYIPFGMVKAGYKNINLRGTQGVKTSFDNTKEILSYPLEKENKVFNTFPVPSYTVLSYLPSVILMKLMTIANINPGIMLYILRIVSLITYTALIYTAITLTPTKKWLFAALALMPTSIYQASTVNTDGITIGFGFIFTAFTLYLAFNEKVKQITTKQTALYILVLTCFLICKFAYAPMIFLFFLIPSHKFENKKQQYTIFSIILLMTIYITAGYYLYTRLLIKASDDVFAQNMYFYTLFHNPTIFIKAMLYTLIVEMKYFLVGFIGLFGWGECRIPAIAGYLYYFVLISFALCNLKTDLKTTIFSLTDKLSFIFIYITYTIFLCTILFLVFGISHTGKLICHFGRYYIPIAPVLFLTLHNNKLPALKTNLLPYINICIINLILFTGLVSIMLRFYQ